MDSLSPGKQHTTLAESVYAELLRRIIEHEVLPGERLIERALAEELDVSRVPVREALRDLVRDGLVEAIPRVGLRVADPSPEALHELLEIRDALDRLAFIWLARRWDGDAATALEDLFARTEAAIAEGRQAEAVRLNARFHTLVRELAGSETLIQVMHPVDARMAWMLGQHWRTAEVLAEHRALAGAIASGDEELIRDLARRHIADSMRLAVEVNPGLA